MVNSLSLATAQNVVVRQAKTATSNGAFRSRFSQMASRSLIVHGGFWAFSNFGGWFFLAEAKSVWSSAEFIFHGILWIICHAHRPYM